MTQFLRAEMVFISLLLAATLVGIAVRRRRVPYTVALVIAGLTVSLWHPIQIDLVPELILSLFVPPLVFEAAFHLDLAELRRNLPGLLMLAVPGVVLTTLIVGALVALTTPLSLPLALVLGALLAATDPVAVVALFRGLGAPRRLTVFVEGESLLNDGTAIVVYNLALLIALSGRFNLLGSIWDFVRVAVGGALIGLSLGWLVSLVIARIDDYLIETTLTTVLAFGAYVMAEQLHFSGVLAVVAAGLVNGNLSSRSMSPTTRTVLFNFWEYVAFLATSLVFLLIGLQVDLGEMLAAWQPILWAVLAVLAARATVVYALSWLANHLGEHLPLRWQHVLNWGGLRGAITLALALGLPASLGMDRELLRAMALGVVLFTLLVQATTMSPLLRWLGIATPGELQVEYEKQRGRLIAIYAAGRHLEQAHREGLLSDHAWALLKPELTERAVSVGKGLAQLLQANPALQAEEMKAARRELLLAERGALVGLRQSGLISPEVSEVLFAEVDTALEMEALPGADESDEDAPQEPAKGEGGHDGLHAQAGSSAGA